jgi:hypothetical protein
MPQRAARGEDLTALENVLFFARGLSVGDPVARGRELLERMDLARRPDDPVHTSRAVADDDLEQPARPRLDAWPALDRIGADARRERAAGGRLRRALRRHVLAAIALVRERTGGTLDRMRVETFRRVEIVLGCCPAC